MKAMIWRLMRNLDSAFDQSPGQTQAFTITFTSSTSVSISSDTLTIVSGGVTTAFSLAGITVQTLTENINAAGLPITLSPVAAVAQNTGAVGLVPFEAVTYPAGTLCALSVAKNPNWIFLESSASEMTAAQSLITQVPDQLTTAAAVAPWLDELGELYGNLQRMDGETDRLYGNRIIAEVLRAKCNNIAMEEALYIYTGNSATVTDVQETVSASTEYGTLRYCLFDVGVNFDPLGYGGSMAAFQTVVLAIINRIRAAGCYLRTLTIVPLNAPTTETQKSGVESGALRIYVDPHYDGTRMHDGSMTYSGHGTWTENLDGSSSKFTPT